MRDKTEKPLRDQFSLTPVLRSNTSQSYFFKVQCWDKQKLEDFRDLLANSFHHVYEVGDEKK